MLTIPETGTLLGVSRPTVLKHIKSGEIPTNLIGRCRRICRIDLESFIANRTATGWQQRPQPQKPIPIDDIGDGDDIQF